MHQYYPSTGMVNHVADIWLVNFHIDLNSFVLKTIQLSFFNRAVADR
jgi:hypothetical protein